MAEPVVQRLRMSGEGFGGLHALWCFLMRQPRLLRVIAGVFRRWPRASRWVAVVARRDAVVAALLRTSTFSNTSHAPNLVAGAFSIGMQDGERYRGDRRTLEAMLLPARRLGPTSAVLARQRMLVLQGVGAQSHFDLVDEFLSPIAWRTIKRCFGRAGDALAVGDSGSTDPQAVEKQLFLDLRHVASHLVVGTVATAQVQSRAEAAGCALNQRVQSQQALVGEALAARLPGCPHADLHRNTVGLLWVSHPVAVQAAVNVVLELMRRQPLHRDLRRRVAEAGGAAWLQPELRARIRDVILELLRFRPPFPVVVRDAPRSAAFEAGDQRPTSIRAGGSLKLLVIGAMFDPRALDRPGEFLPGAGRWRHEDDRYLVFGLGQRRCPGQEHALEILTSMLVGLLMLPRPIRLDGRNAQSYDGPVTDHLRLVF